MSRASRRTLVSHKLRPFDTGDAAADQNLDETLRDHTAQTFEKLRYLDKYTPDHEITKAEADAGVTPVDFTYGVCNVLRYGTNTTPGTTDMSQAFANAIAVANQLAFSGTYQHGTYQVIVPAGDYLVNTGVTTVNLYCEIIGDGKEVTRINVASGQYFLTASATVVHFKLQGITFNGGKGYVAHTYTGTNVQNHFDVLNCSFFLYTECAIGTLASDFPYWKIKGCLFYGTTALTSKGIVHSGNPDSVTIEDCSFLRNRYHVKCARGNNMKFVRCDFLRFQDGGGNPVLVDVWIVPYSSSVNAGAAFEFINCKLGNETLNVADARILVADEGSGTNAFDKNYSGSPSTGFLDGLAIRGGYIGGSSNMVRGFIYSFTPNIRNLTIDSYWDGGRYPWVVEFDVGVPVPNDRTFDSWCINLTNLSSPFDSAFGAISNAKTVNRGRDPFNLLFGRSDFKNEYSVGNAPGFLSLWNQANAGATAFSTSSASKSNITDSVGDADAIEATYSATSGSVFADVDTPTVGRLAWAEIEVMVGASLPLTQLLVRVDNSGGDTIALQTVAIPATWQRIRVPFMVRSIASGVHLSILPGDYSAGVKTKVKLGRPIVYHATDQTDPGQRYLSAQKTFDWASIANGASATTTVTVTGAVFGDFCLASMGLSVAGLTLTAYVSAADTVTVVAANQTGGAVDLASGTLRVRVQKAVVYH